MNNSDGLLIAFYGDDFTGSSAVMETLSFAGLPTVLFLEPPTPEELKMFSEFRAIGVAGIARSESPEWMEKELPPVFAALEALDAPIMHYKTCSTLDSSPVTGSIGRAYDIAKPIFTKRDGAANWQPLIIGAPAIGRYQTFGNLFATFDGQQYRLDRHPVMKQHPSTPMNESDVACHIEKQTVQKVGLIDFIAIKSGDGSERLSNQIKSKRNFVSIDVMDQETLEWAGGQIWSKRGSGIFAVGSQGVEYALTAHWKKTGLIPEEYPQPVVEPVDQIIVVSASVSPTNEAQIRWASKNGFEIVTVNPTKAVSLHTWQKEIENSVNSAKQILSNGKSPLLATALGPEDPSVKELVETISNSKMPTAEVNARIGTGLGEALSQLLKTSGLRRAVVAGGDTSGYATRALRIHALTALAPIAPGSPLCHAYADSEPGQGLEIALKGGQMGPVEFFGIVRDGGYTIID